MTHSSLVWSFFVWACHRLFLTCLISWLPHLLCEESVFLLFFMCPTYFSWHFDVFLDQLVSLTCSSLSVWRAFHFLVFFGFLTTWSPWLYSSIWRAFHFLDFSWLFFLFDSWLLAQVVFTFSTQKPLTLTLTLMSVHEAGRGSLETWKEILSHFSSTEKPRGLIRLQINRNKIIVSWRTLILCHPLVQAVSAVWEVLATLPSLKNLTLTLRRGSGLSLVSCFLYMSIIIPMTSSHHSL